MWYFSASTPRRLDGSRPLGTPVGSYDCEKQPCIDLNGRDSGTRALMIVLSRPWSDSHEAQDDQLLVVQGITSP